MPKPKTNLILNNKPQSQITLSEYVTAIAWSANSKYLAVATAAGELALFDDEIAGSQIAQKQRELQPPTEISLDCLGFSADSRWLAAGGQDGKVRVWSLASEIPTIAATLDLGNKWIEHLAWHPTRNELAFSFGKYVQIWSAKTLDIITTLNFENSTILAIAWHPLAPYFMVGGDGGVMTWNAQDWYEDPVPFEIPTAVSQLSWSKTGEYLVASTLDNLVIVMHWLGHKFDPSPWRMQGFPGKIRSFDWSESKKSPLLSSSSGSDVVVWSNHIDPNIGWEGELLKGHNSIVGSVAFKPKSETLASADENGRITIWKNAKDWVQALDTPMGKITALQWQPQGKKLVAANADGELMIWTESSQGKGFR
ncbi:MULTISPECIES: WD40 repeat domain-containing protein [Pseudanabaena]|uniref:WD-40 repeat-containing protein n=2 Tax=Pseudanabaena TaxID=1152 RepID=L8N4W7_9CYAN|nr:MULTISPECIES: WD40 repeat domain-containing protein [Pseudanabaena]ELS33740.1 WD-40 repeat-containing protein [Pseudanabaena biceps PCC 7429]MDG3494077.1 WD40 repeat domain-containing protein [Pseudanabaena catenata USMAC16]